MCHHWGASDLPCIDQGIDFYKEYLAQGVYSKTIIGASLRTSGTALLTCVCMLACLLACLLACGHIP